MVEHLSQIAPGAELGALLEVVDRGALDGPGRVAVMQARARQIAHLQAQLMADMVAVAGSVPSATPGASVDSRQVDWAAAEIGSALHLTRHAAEDWLGLATDVLRDLPRVHSAMLAGLVDLPKARVFCRELSLASTVTRSHVLDTVLPDAPDLTTGQLGVRIRRLVTAGEPAQAKQRYESGVAGRRVQLRAEPDGTATVTGWQLPADRAVAALERVDAMAKAAKRAGDERSMDQIRADTFLDLLGGVYSGLPPMGRTGVVELTVPLTTLLGLTDTPGDLAGFGPVVAEIARKVAADQETEAVWRYTVLDERGAVRYHGTVRRRPTPTVAAAVRARSRTCVFPGCRVPASRCDLDHRRRHADGGPATVDNMQPLCRKHHRAKDEGGWRSSSLGDNQHHWVSPLGLHYDVWSEPVQPP